MRVGTRTTVDESLSAADIHMHDGLQVCALFHAWERSSLTPPPCALVSSASVDRLGLFLKNATRRNTGPGRHGEAMMRPDLLYTKRLASDG